MRPTAFVVLAAAASLHAQPAPVTTIPFRVDQVIFVDVAINGTPTSLVLDTGAPGISIDPALAERAGVLITRPLTDRRDGAGHADSVRIGGVLLRDQSVDVRPFAAVNGAPSARSPIVGVVGTTFLRRFVARLDFEARQLTLYDAATYAYTGSGVVTPITFVEEKPVVRASLVSEGRPPVQARLFVDAGAANTPVGLTPAFARSVGIPADGAPSIEIVGARSLYGGGMDRVTRLAAVDVGPLHVAAPIVWVSEALGAAISHLKADGTVGLALLSRTTLILDYARSRIIFEPRPGFEAPFVFPNVSGLQLQRREKSVVVRHVIATSPADSAGLRPDDELVAVDDVPVPTEGPAAPPQLQQAGTTHRVTFRRGGETRTVVLALRPLL